MNNVEVRGEFIKLDSFLKFCGAVDTGGRAKLVIQEGHVKVNGEACIMRGKKIRNDDIVEFGGETYVCKTAQI